MSESGEERALAAVVAALANTAAGRRFDLARVRSLADLQAHAPMMDVASHAREVEAHLGFGTTDAGDPRARELSGAIHERAEVTAVWRGFLRGEEVRRAIVLQAREIDGSVDRIVVDDLAALGAEVLRVERVDDEEALLAMLEEVAPTIIAAPSSFTLGWLEELLGRPLERAVPSLRLLLAGHDLGRRLRSRLPVESAGWIHRSGRLGLPSPRPPARAFTLAVGSQVIELLPHQQSDDGLRAFEAETIAPAQAILGRHYELVVSSPLGCLRLRTDEHVQVVGFDPPTSLVPTPRPRVIRLRPPPQEVALEGISMVGVWLTAAVRQAFRPEDPALVAATIGPDPGAIDVAQTSTRALKGDPFAETELGGAGRSGVRARPLLPRRLLVQVEVQGLGRADLAERLAKAIDADLRRRSPAYDHLRGRRELRAPRVTIVAPGSFKNAQARRIRGLRGRVGTPEVRVVGRERASIFPSATHWR
jgi:hypothetical protein